MADPLQLHSVQANIKPVRPNIIVCENTAAEVKPKTIPIITDVYARKPEPLKESTVGAPIILPQIGPVHTVLPAASYFQGPIEETYQNYIPVPGDIQQNNEWVNDLSFFGSIQPTTSRDSLVMENSGIKYVNETQNTFSDPKIYETEVEKFLKKISIEKNDEKCKSSKKKFSLSLKNKKKLTKKEDYIDVRNKSEKQTSKNENISSKQATDRKIKKIQEQLKLVEKEIQKRKRDLLLKEREIKEELRACPEISNNEEEKWVPSAKRAKLIKEDKPLITKYAIDRRPIVKTDNLFMKKKSTSCPEINTNKKIKSIVKVPIKLKSAEKMTNDQTKMQEENNNTRSVFLPQSCVNNAINIHPLKEPSQPPTQSHKKINIELKERHNTQNNDLSVMIERGKDKTNLHIGTTSSPNNNTHDNIETLELNVRLISSPSKPLKNYKNNDFDKPSEAENSPSTDFSFLDDIDIDKIVEILNTSDQKQNIKNTSVTQPYEDSKNQSSLLYDQDELREIVKVVHRSKTQVAISLEETEDMNDEGIFKEIVNHNSTDLVNIPTDDSELSDSTVIINDFRNSEEPIVIEDNDEKDIIDLCDENPISEGNRYVLEDRDENDEAIEIRVRSFLDSLMSYLKKPSWLIEKNGSDMNQPEHPPTSESYKSANIDLEKIEKKNIFSEIAIELRTSEQETNEQSLSENTTQYLKEKASHSTLLEKMDVITNVYPETPTSSNDNEAVVRDVVSSECEDPQNYITDIQEMALDKKHAKEEIPRIITEDKECQDVSDESLEKQNNCISEVPAVENNSVHDNEETLIRGTSNLNLDCGSTLDNSIEENTSNTKEENFETPICHSVEKQNSIALDKVNPEKTALAANENNEYNIIVSGQISEGTIDAEIKEVCPNLEPEINQILSVRKDLLDNKVNNYNNTEEKHQEIQEEKAITNLNAEPEIINPSKMFNGDCTEVKTENTTHETKQVCCVKSPKQDSEPVEEAVNSAEDKIKILDKISNKPEDAVKQQGTEPTKPELNAKQAQTSEKKIQKLMDIEIDRPLMNTLNKNPLLKPITTATSNSLGENMARTIEMKLFEKFNRKYKISGIIHCGNFSKIYEFKSATGEMMAAKILSSKTNHCYLKMEKIKNILRDNEDRASIVNFIWNLKIDGQWCYLLDYYPQNMQEALWQRKKSFHIDTVQILARQLLAALLFLRRHCLVHMAIQPGHILLNMPRYKLKLCGFDEACHIDQIAEENWLNLSDVSFRAPEIILGYKLGYAVDIWSAALVIHQMATNRNLFRGFTTNDVLFQQMRVLGSVPPYMLKMCAFRSHFYSGRKFIRTLKDTISYIPDNFYRTGRMGAFVYQAYNRDWRGVKNIDHNASIEKIRQMTSLLDKMLVTDPGRRLSIEFAYADPFIYEYRELLPLI